MSSQATFTSSSAACSATFTRPRRGARLIQLTEPYVTNLAQLRELIRLAKDRGCEGMALPQGRALVVSSLPACLRRWGADHAEQGRVLVATRQQVIEQAGIGTAMHHIRGSAATPRLGRGSWLPGRFTRSLLRSARR